MVLDSLELPSGPISSLSSGSRAMSEGPGVDAAGPFDDEENPDVGVGDAGAGPFDDEDGPDAGAGEVGE